MWLELFISALGLVIADSVISDIYENWEKQMKMHEARAFADSLKKPVLNVGCGNNPREIGDVNVDLLKPEECILPNYIQANVYNLPFRDKQFGSAVASHLLEHVDDPKKMLAELSRVADRVFIAVPAPFNYLANTRLDHKYVFNWDMRKNMPLLWIMIILGTLGILAYLTYLEVFK